MTSNLTSFRGIVTFPSSVVFVWRSMSKILIFRRMFYVIIRNKIRYCVSKGFITTNMSNSFRNIQEHYFVITLNSDSLNSVVNVSLNDGWRLWRTVLVVNSFNIKWVFFRRDRLVSFTKLNLTNGSLVLEYSLGGKSSALWKTKKVFLARNHYFNEF